VKRLEKYHWPGNVRELQHAIERAVIMSDSKNLKPEDFFFSGSSARPDALTFDNYNLEDVEKAVIRRVLSKHAGNISHAADELGLTRTSLYRRMEKYGL
jgi:transcriptional regulator with PAS, ATPase and Fis domain